jgi:hypothetical protein
MKRGDNISVRLGGPFRPPWAKRGEPWVPHEVPAWKEPPWWKERMYEHPLYKYVTRIELDYFARTGRVMRASTLAKRLRGE